MVLNLTIGEVIAPFTRNRDIPPEKVRAFRERRGWTHEQMADEVWATPLEVAAWEAGTVRVPAEQAQRMRTIAAATPPAPVRVPAQPALPRCAWAEAHAPGLYEILWLDREVPSNVHVQRHLAKCPACQRVIQRDRTVPPPAPAPGRAPREPADDLGPDLSAWDILVLFMLMAVPLVLLLTSFVVVPKDLLDSAADVWIAGSMGFLAYEIARRFVRTWLPRRPYAAGLVMAVSGMLTAMLTWKLQDPEGNLFGPLMLAGCALVALLVGLLTGWMRDGHEPDDAEPPRAEADATPPSPAVLLPAPDPLAELDDVREPPRPQRAGAAGREGA